MSYFRYVCFVCVLWCTTHVVLCFCLVCLVRPKLSFSKLSILDCRYGFL